MLTQSEIGKIIEDDGELAAIERCAVSQVDGLLETLNKFVDESAAYRHPAVAIATLAELALTVITQVLEKEKWEEGVGMVIEQLQYGLKQAQQEEEEVKEEAVDG